jgi:UDP-glucuronate decarboxylase
MKLLVTGAAGFLGSHLSESLLQMGHEVLALDNFYTGSKRNISHLLDNPNFELIRHDITQPLILECEGIFNFACPASPVHYQRTPVQTMKTNVHGAINVLDLAHRTKARVLQASTSEVYGDPTIHPQPENYFGNVNPNGPRACYDEGKRAAETLFFDYHRQLGVDIRIVRIFNTYGPRMSKDDGRVVSNFINSALENKPITVYGDGNQTRSFCYVEDLISGIIKMFFQEEALGPINLGTDFEFTMNELAHKVIDLSGSSSVVIHEELPIDDPKQRRPDLSQAQKYLGWSPRVSLEDGLRETISYFRGLS